MAITLESTTSSAEQLRKDVFTFIQLMRDSKVSELKTLSTAMKARMDALDTAIQALTTTTHTLT